MTANTPRNENQEPSAPTQMVTPPAPLRQGVAALEPNALSGRGVSVFPWQSATWLPMELGGVPIDGFSWWPLAGDEAGGWDAYWMRVDAGARSLMHVHPATELLHIFEGHLADMNQRIYGPGDVAIFAAGSEHFTHSATGCIALVVTGKQAAVIPGAG
jgi:anti-sigma factor ChrR (cupin superfamily)